MIWNFSAGPAMLPQEVLKQAQAELLDWQGMGVSVMEVSHRSPEFEALAHEAKQDLRDLLHLPDTFEILFTTGGAQAQFALVPMNLLPPEGAADYLITGTWSQKSVREAERFANIHVAADSEASNFTTIPSQDTWRIREQSKYFHFVSNETVHGVQFQTFPHIGKPLVIDLSSEILSRPIDFTRVGLIYAGAQKNMGPAGMTVVMIRKDWLDHCTTRTPAVFSYPKLAFFHSLINTAPTFSWYLAGLVFKWVKRQGGLRAMAERNAEKASVLYRAIDESQLYQNPVDPLYRSHMNVVFDFTDETLLPKFLIEAKAQGFIGLKGHKTRGGVRASIYNAMPLEGVQALVHFMKEFEKKS